MVMMRKIIKPAANQPRSVQGNNRRDSRWVARILEGVIFLLIGLNAYLVYSVTRSATSYQSVEQLSEEILDPSVFKIQVEVLNGCGEQGIGQFVMRYLRTKGFDVVNIDNADHFEYSETFVLDRRATNKPSVAAHAVGNALGTHNVLLQQDKSRMVDVSVVIGNDYQNLLFHEETD